MQFSSFEIIAIHTLAKFEQNNSVIFSYIPYVPLLHIKSNHVIFRIVIIMSHNPYQKEDHFGRGVTASQKATIRAFDKFYSWFPSFLDVFPDEDAWLSFVFWFVLATIVVAIVISRYIVIKPHML